MKRVTILTVCVMALSVTANAAIIPWDKVSFVGGAGVAVPLADDNFQDHWKESIHSTLGIEAEVLHNVSLYGNYQHETFDPKTGNFDQIDMMSFGAGVMVFGALNTWQSVRGYIELGLAGNIQDGQDKTWTFQPGVGVDFNLTDTGASGLRLGCKWRNYDDAPDKIQAIMPQVLLRISPGK